MHQPLATQHTCLSIIIIVIIIIIIIIIGDVIQVLYRVAQKTSRTLHNYNGAYTLWGEISFGTFVDQYVLLLTYKFQ